MNIQNTAGSGVRGFTAVQDFTFTNGTINNSGTGGGNQESSIAFNDPSNPTDFIIIGGYHRASPGAPPPTSVSGSFGSPNPSLSVTGHLFHVQGTAVTEWRASIGSAALQNCGAVFLLKPIV